MHRIRTTIAAAAIAAAALTAGLVAASPAFACDSGNCTNGQVTIGSVLGTTGFPTSFAITTTNGSNGTASGSATASPYSVFSNGPWVLSFADDSADVVTSGSPVGPMWTVTNAGAVVARFDIPSSTTITHASVVDHLPPGSATSTPPYVTSVQIDSGNATNGGQNFADVFTVTVPASVAAGSYLATFDYVLAA